MKGSLLIMKAVKKNSLYVLQGNTVVVGADMAQETGNKSKLWHLRLAMWVKEN